MVVRKLLHMGMGLPALLVCRLPPALITCMLLGFLVFNLLFFHALLPKVFVHKQKSVLSDRGIWLYPLVLMVLSMVLAHQPVLLVVAWGMLAYGDGAAALAGIAFKGPALPWNPHKTWLGTFAFIVNATAGTLLTVWLMPDTCRAGIDWHLWVWVVAITAVVCALAETVPGLVNDNIAVTACAGLVSWVALAALLLPAPAWPWWHTVAMVLLAVGALAAYLNKTLDAPGSLAGWAVALALYLGTGIAGIAMLAAFFIAGMWATRWQMDRKLTMGLAEEHRGQRSYANVLANGIVPAGCGLLAWLLPNNAALYIAMAAAGIASITADTLASELGNVLGSRYINIITFGKGQRGADGVISLEGTLAGAAGALLIAVLYFLFTGLLTAALLVALAGVLGCLADSLLGATLQRRGLMNNHTVNMASALVAALMLYWLY